MKTGTRIYFSNRAPSQHLPKIPFSNSKFNYQQSLQVETHSISENVSTKHLTVTRTKRN